MNYKNKERQDDNREIIPVTCSDGGMIYMPLTSEPTYVRHGRLAKICFPEILNPEYINSNHGSYQLYNSNLGFIYVELYQENILVELRDQEKREELIKILKEDGWEFSVTERFLNCTQFRTVSKLEKLKKAPEYIIKTLEESVEEFEEIMANSDWLGIKNNYGWLFSGHKYERDNGKIVARHETEVQKEIMWSFWYGVVSPYIKKYGKPEFVQDNSGNTKKYLVWRFISNYGELKDEDYF